MDGKIDEDDDITGAEHRAAHSGHLCRENIHIGRSFDGKKKIDMFKA